MNRVYASDFNVCRFTCFDDVLFHSKTAVEDEAEVVDDSRELGFSIIERNCEREL